MDTNLYFALSAGFPQIVSLLATFYSLNNGKTDLDEFKTWLDNSSNQYALEIIDNNEQLQSALITFMSANHKENMAKLSNLTDLIIDIASKIDGLSKLTTPFKNSNQLSTQAISVLRQFVESKSPNMQHVNTYSLGDHQIDFILEKAEKIQYEDPIFIEDDVDNLVDRGLITIANNMEGNTVYKITRRAVEFIESIDS